MQDNYFTSATVWMIVWLVIGAVVTIASSLLTVRTLFPEFAGRCAGHCRQPVRSFFLGLLAAGAAAALILTALRTGRAGHPLAWVTGGTVILAALAGASGQVVRMAARTAHDGESSNSWGASRRAAAILTMSYVLPLAGWLVILPVSLLTGLGCTLRSLRAPRTAAVSTAPVHAAVPPLPEPLPYS